MSHLMKLHKSITTLQGSSDYICLSLIKYIWIGEDIVFLATDINLPGAVDWVFNSNIINE